MACDTFDTLLERADAFYHAGYWTSGVEPTHFLVTNEEYRALLRSDDSTYLQRAYRPDVPMRLMGMVVCCPHHWCPAMAALQLRADVYATQQERETGHRPDRWLVTDADAQCLRTHQQGTRGLANTADLWFWGMRIVQPVHSPWYERHSWMEHFKGTQITLRPLQPRDPCPPSPSAIHRCRTELPLDARSEVICPCGEVIWDLTSAQDLLAAVQSGVLTVQDVRERMGYAAHDGAHDPLPPLDDLDEGLTCCYRTYATFAAYMAHRRGHSEA